MSAPPERSPSPAEVDWKYLPSIVEIKQKDIENPGRIQWKFWYSRLRYYHRGWMKLALWNKESA